jgi:hypothetical protein
MDCEYFLRRHDEELAKAASATCEAASAAHEGLARCFKEAAERVGSPMPVQSMQPSYNEQPQTA